MESLNCVGFMAVAQASVPAQVDDALCIYYYCIVLLFFITIHRCVRWLVFGLAGADLL